MANVHIEVGSAVKAASPRVRAIQKAGERILRSQLGDRDGLRFIDNRVRRDGDDPHITILSPQEHKTAITTGVLTRELLSTVAIPDDFRVMGLGRAVGGGSTAYFVVVDWPGGEAFRASLGFDPNGPGGNGFHLTVGFDDAGDVHGVSKTKVWKAASLRSSLIRLAYSRPDLQTRLLPLLK